MCGGDACGSGYDGRTGHLGTILPLNLHFFHSAKPLDDRMRGNGGSCGGGDNKLSYTHKKQKTASREGGGVNLLS